MSSRMKGFTGHRSDSEDILNTISEVKYIIKGFYSHSR